MSNNSLITNDAIIRALDVLNFDSGDWNPEHIERHLHEQIELAKEILNTAPATQGDDESSVRHFLIAAENMIDEYPHLYVELARTRATDWMAWICTHNKDTHPNRKILTNGQGSTVEEACENALQTLPTPPQEQQS